MSRLCSLSLSAPTLLSFQDGKMKKKEMPPDHPISIPQKDRWCFWWWCWSLSQRLLPKMFCPTLHLKWCSGHAKENPTALSCIPHPHTCLASLPVYAQSHTPRTSHQQELTAERLLARPSRSVFWMRLYSADPCRRFFQVSVWQPDEERRGLRTRLPLCMFLCERLTKRTC